MSPKGISRRDFVKGALVTGSAAAASAVLGACQPAPAGANIPAKWDKEADVVCIGFGGAGAVTAITAADLGASVIILEKEPKDTDTEVRHTPSTRMCGGLFVCPTDPVKASEHLFALSWGATPKDVCDAWGKYAVENAQWLEKMGIELIPTDQYLGKGEFPELPGGDSIQARRVKGNGPALFQGLAAQVARRRSIEVIYKTPGKELVTDCSGMVIGVIAESEGKQIAVKAKKAVVLTCGGFEWDEEMKRNFLRGYPSFFYCNPGNTGDGIRMATKVGAALWHMNVISGRVIPKFPDVVPAMQGGTPDGFILVDKLGRRFFRERPWASHSAWLEVCKFDTSITDYPAIPCYSVFDDVALKKGAPANGQPKGLGADGKQQNWYTWSKDSVEEIKKGWVLKGDTIEDLAKAIAADPENGGRMTPEALKATIGEYNRACEAQKDDKFGRDPKTLIPIKQGPFYAIKLYPGGPNTQGGPKKNAKAQVLDGNDQPIPHLYCVGELGSVYGFLYPTGGGNVCEMIAFGRICGENVVKEKPWS